ncbi:fumarylacetoacetate hydrolase family protein [Jiulongibacter sediminis]|jgi:2-dehydro-3-deoxy-D-arabinonate dehydratase|uniref:fumarylacetoacetate hydrolase family protein n=1 Tax=Jiulongibacter sediminis TaxID=1605367 RepID=UPI0026F13236|nr:fumarylacetoacetate hydrolase family protein [Jiulongibacter sediminis]
MKLYKTSKGFVVEDEGKYYLSKHTNWDEFINRENLYFEVKREIQNLKPDFDYLNYIKDYLQAPIAGQEVWASGVTYLRSKNARMEESKDAGGGDFYDRVYDAPRPEIFFKATVGRVVGNGENIRIRKDSKWNVPEPELTLFINSSGQISGYTVGNDVSSRDIEGENPLYLPQAKSYDKSAALGPCIFVSDEPIDPQSKITLEIFRGGNAVFSQSIELNQMKRTLKELVSYLYAECTFVNGSFLMTGTGIIPEDSFSLQVGDKVEITIDNIGKLSNTVETK